MKRAPIEMENDPSGSLIPPPPTSSPPPILLDTVFLLFLRFVYFLLSRRFLLSTLNPTLRDLSKPDTLLPPTASMQAENGRSRNQSHSIGINPLSDNELDTEDDNVLSRIIPYSSYPPSPSKPVSSFPTSSQPSRDPLMRRNAEESFLHAPGSSSSLPTIPEGSGGDIELQALGQKLKDVGAGMGKKAHVLQLSHGRRGDVIATQGIKKATRGLSRLAR